MTTVTEMSAVSAEGLTKRYGGRRGVQDVSFTVGAGQVCALPGRNGAGKTTTMRLLVGLSRSDRGRAWLLGEPVTLAAGLGTASHAGGRDGHTGLYGASALVVALFGSALGAADRVWGTLRYLYVQPVSPRRLILGKWSGLSVCAALAMGCILISGVAAGLAIFGWHPSHRSGAPSLSSGTAAVRLLAGAGYLTGCVLSVGAIALCLGTWLPGPADALGQRCSVRRAVEPLREFDDQASGSADVTEQEHALVVDDLPDGVPAGLANAVNDAPHIVDGEGDVSESRTVRGRRRLLSGCGRRVEAHHLEYVAAVGGTCHHDLDRRVRRDR